MILSSRSLHALLACPMPLAQRPNGVPIDVDIASITLHLGSTFLTYDPPDPTPFVPPQARRTTAHEGTFVLSPGGKLLGCTAEVVSIPKDLVGFVQTKGSLARGFLIVHLCDGQIDPGFRGTITLEIVNLGDFHFRLEPGMPIAQLFLHRLDEPVIEGYDGRYQDATGPTAMLAPKSKSGGDPVLVEEDGTNDR